VAKDPTDLDAVSGLAVVLESRRDFEGCEKLLTPHAAKLGDREGARILGQIYVNKGKFEEAYGLLAPYAEERLKQLKNAEDNVNQLAQQIDNEGINALRQQSAPDFDFNAYKAANKEAQQRMIQEFLDKRLREDPRFQKARAALRGQRGVVQAGMDL